MVVEDQSAPELGPRRSGRARKLTEKGQELQDAKVKGLQSRFLRTYNRWKALARKSKTDLDEPSSSNEILKDLINNIDHAANDVLLAYEDLRKCITPDGETRRRTDNCQCISKTLIVVRELKT